MIFIFTLQMFRFKYHISENDYLQLHHYSKLMIIGNAYIYRYVFIIILNVSVPSLLLPQSYLIVNTKRSFGKM